MTYVLVDQCQKKASIARHAAYPISTAGWWSPCKPKAVSSVVTKYADWCAKKALALSGKENFLVQKAFQEQDETKQSESLRWVFAKAGRPMHQTSTHAWREALIKAGINDFCWHDLRHTWASWHVQNGTPLHVLQELGGWSSLKMVQRYAHLSGEHLRHWIERPTLKSITNNETASYVTFSP